MKNTSKHVSIANAIKQRAMNERWQRNDRIPTQRELAKNLGTSLQTVNLAIRYLETSGAIKSVKGSGCYWNADTFQQKSNLIDLTTFQTPQIIFSGAVGDSININETPAYLTDLVIDWVIKCGASPSTTNANLMLTHSAPSALMLAMLMVKQAKGAILCDPLVDGMLLNAARATGVELIPCATDQQGLIPSEMSKALLKSNIKAIYLTPSGSNPMCTVAMPQRRIEWAEIAEQNRCLIIENHCLAPFSFTDCESLHSLLPDQTVHIQSFNNQISDSIEMAALIASESLVRMAMPYMTTLGCAAGKSAAYFLYQLMSTDQHLQIFEQNKSWLKERYAIVQKKLRSPHNIRQTSTHAWFDWPVSEQALLALQYRNIRLAGEKSFLVNNDTPPTTGFRMSILNQYSNEQFSEVMEEITNTLNTTADQQEGII